MDKSEYLVESPPKPPRKLRRKPMCKRDRGIEVARRNGQFVMPCEMTDSTPIVAGVCELTLKVYNCVAVLKMVKSEMEFELLTADGESVLLLKRGLSILNKRIYQLRKVGFEFREYILKVEDGKPLNEPKDWGRN